MNSFLRNHWIMLVFVAIYLLFSVVTHQVYGISYDEQNVYNRADALYQHLLTNNVDPGISYSLLFQSSPQDVNVFYNNFYGMVLRIFNPTQSYELYHLYNLVFSLSIFIASYLLLYSLTKKQSLAILGPVFLVLSPVFFGHIPINPKDMPFAVFYFLSIVAIYFLAKKKSLLSILVLGILFGLTQSGRVVGFTLYFILLNYSLYLSFNELKDKPKKEVIKSLFDQIIHLGLIFIVAAFFMIITWPYMGSSFLKHFANLFLVSKNFPWNGDVLFQGIKYAGNHLPRFYIPTMFFIQTPIFILFFFISSLFFIKKKNSQNFLFLFWFTLGINLILYIGLKPVSLIRHYLYIFPIIASLAAFGFINFLNYFPKNKVKVVIIVLVFLNIVNVTFQTVKLFPYEYTYFNELVDGTANAKNSYSVDVWAQSNKEAVLWLENYTKNSQKIVSVYVCGNTFSATYYFPSKFHAVKKTQEADYSICETPVTEEDKKIKGNVIHTITRDNITMNSIYKKDI